MADQNLTAPLRYSDITDPIVMSSHSILSRQDLDDHLTTLAKRGGIAQPERQPNSRE